MPARRRGRPDGYQMSEESKDLIRNAQLRSWEKRKSWADMSNAIIACFEEGRDEDAKELYREFMAARKKERTAILNSAKYRNARPVSEGE